MGRRSWRYAGMARAEHVGTQGMPRVLGVCVVLWLAACSPAGALERGGPEPVAPVMSSPCACLLRPGDEVWIVSTRSLGDPHCTALRAPDVHRFRCETGWQQAAWDELCTASPLLTVVTLHGNRYTHADAVDAGWDVYRLLTCGTAAEPLRLVIWSWPSQQVAGPVRDARVKNERAYYEGYYLAQYLGSIENPGPLSLLGYSYGARIVCSALDGLQRGHVDGVPLMLDAPPSIAPARVALLAAAMEDVDLLPGGRYELAPQLVDQLLVTRNSADPALRRYHALERNRRRERAMGVVGLAGAVATQLVQLNATLIVGRSHDVDRYYRSAWMASNLRRHLLWWDVAP